MRCPIIVGRDAELTGLLQRIDQAAAGHGSCVIVTGEAGVGKTRLVTEAAAQARRHGHVTLLGRTSPTDRSSPLRPLAEALLGALRDLEPPAEPALVPYLPALGTLLPHWADTDGVAPAVPPAPVVLAEAVLRVLRWLAGSGEASHAAVLVLEDLHWVDHETLAVLEYVVDHVGEVPAAVLLTLRSDEPSTAGIQSAFGNATPLALRPLDGSDVAAMAAACLGVADAPTELVDGLRRAGGLPLVVEDLIFGGEHTGPIRYAEIVSRRLGDLDAAARSVVDTAAVLGNEVDPDLLGPVTGLLGEPLASALADAEATALLAAQGERLAFRHALVRELVLAALPWAARTAISHAAATVLDRIDAERAAISGRLGELWEQGGDLRRAAEALRRAAAGARITGATSTAEELLRRALVLAPADMAGSLRLELLELLAVSGQVEKLASVGTQALDELAHDPDLTAAVNLLLARAAVSAGVPQDAQPHLEAVSAIGELTPRQSAQLRIVQAGAVMGSSASDRLSATGHLAGQAVAFAEQAGDPELTCEALELQATAVRIKDLTTAAEMLQRELAVAERAGLVLWRLRALNELGTVELLRDARPDRLERALELALRIGAVDTAASVAINLAAAYAMTGAIEAALVAAERGRQLAEPLGAAGAVAAAIGIEGVTHGFAGRRAEMRRLVRQATELSPDDADLAAFTLAAGHGLAALLQEERPDAIDAFRRARQLATPVRTLDAAVGPLLLVEAVQGSDVGSEIETEQARATVGARWSAAWLGYAHAVALGAGGDRVAAGSAFEAAERAADRYPLFRAIALRLAAEAAMQHGFGDPVGWLRDAEAEFVGRGLNRTAAACRGLLARAGAPTARRRGQDVALPPRLLRLGVTAREAEVLDLVGEHLSNKDIAARLYLSPRTVEKHVASLLLKTGSPDRAALTLMARHG